MMQAAEHWIARLRRDPQDAEAFSGLRQWYVQTSDYAALLELLEGWAARATRPEQAAAALSEAADISFRYLRDQPRGVHFAEQAFLTFPYDDGLLDQLVDKLEAMGDPRRLLHVLEDLIARTEAQGLAPARMAVLHVALGDAWEKHFRRPDRAVSHYKRGYEMDPTLVTAIYAAREIYRKAGNYRMAAKLYAMEATAEMDVVRKGALYRELGHLCADFLHDAEGAISAFAQAVTLAPRQPEPRQELARAYIRRADSHPNHPSAQQDREQAAALFFEIAQREPADSAMVHAERALDALPTFMPALELLERFADSDDKQAALVTRWIGYLNAAPQGAQANAIRFRLAEAYMQADQMEDAVRSLAPLLQTGDQRAAAILLDAYRALHDHEGLSRALHIRIKQAQGAERLLLMREMLGVLSHLQQWADAAEYAREVLAVDAADTNAISLMERHFRENGDDQSLRNLLLTSGMLAAFPVTTRVLYLREAAEIDEQKLGNLADAIQTWSHVLSFGDAIDASHIQEAEASLARLYARCERWEALVALKRRQVTRTKQGRQRARLLKEIADIHQHKLADRSTAIALLEQVVVLDEADKSARNELCTLLLEAERYADAAPLLRERVRDADDPSLAYALRRTLADILETELHEPEESYAIAEDMLRERPEDGDTLDRLERINLALEEHGRLVQLLEKRLDQPKLPDEERVSLLLRMGRLSRDHLNDPKRAIALFEEALHQRPQALHVLAEAQEALGGVEAPDAVASFYKKHIDFLGGLGGGDGGEGTAQGAPSKSPAARRKRRGGKAKSTTATPEAEGAEETREGDASDAPTEDGAEKPDAGDAAEAALAADERAAEESETSASHPPREWKGLHITELQLDVAKQRARFLALCEGKDAETTKAWELASTFAEDEEALTALRHAYNAEGNEKKRADILGRLAAIAEDAAQKRDLMLDQADILCQSKRSRKAALKVLHAVADEIDIDCVPALTKLAELYQESEEHASLASALERLLRCYEDDGLKAPIIETLYNLYAVQIGDDHAAADALQRWTVIDKENPAPFRLLRERLHAASSWEALRSNLQTLVELEPDQEDREECLIAAANVSIEELDDPMWAWEALMSLVQEGHEGAIATMRLAAKQAKRLQELAEIFVELAKDDMRTGGLVWWRHACAIFEEDLGDSEQALEAALRALALDLEDDALRETVESLVAKLGCWDRLEPVYARILKERDNEEERLGLTLHYAALLEHEAERPSEALDQYVRAMSMSEQTDILDRVEQLALQTGRFDELIAIYDRRRKKAESPEEAIGFLMRSASVCESELGDRDHAMLYLSQAAAQAASVASLWPDLLELATVMDEQSGDASTRRMLVDVYRGRLDAHELTTEQKSDLLQHVVALLTEDVADPWTAISLLLDGPLDALENDDLYAQAMEVAEHFDLFEEVERHLAKQAQESMEAGPAVVYLMRQAALLEEPLRRYADAADAYARVRSLQANHGEAFDGQRRTLRAAERYQDLVYLLEHEADLCDVVDRKALLLSEAAEVWEAHLKNPVESVELWKRVTELLPDDDRAMHHLERLSVGTARIDLEADNATLRDRDHDRDGDKDRDENKADAEADEEHGCADLENEADGDADEDDGDDLDAGATNIVFARDLVGIEARHGRERLEAGQPDREEGTGAEAYASESAPSHAASANPTDASESPSDTERPDPMTVDTQEENFERRPGHTPSTAPLDDEATRALRADDPHLGLGTRAGAPSPEQGQAAHATDDGEDLPAAQGGTVDDDAYMEEIGTAELLAESGQAASRSSVPPELPKPHTVRLAQEERDDIDDSVRGAVTAARGEEGASFEDDTLLEEMDDDEDAQDNT